jgi:hypothetical protein
MVLKNLILVVTLAITWKRTYKSRGKRKRNKKQTHTSAKRGNSTCKLSKTLLVSHEQ